MAKVKLTRQQLYDLVWQKPATKLAKELEISDVAIGKMCKRYNIPRPSTGYWAKLAAGKRVIQQPLPKAKSWFYDHCYVTGDGGAYYYSHPRLAYWEPANDSEPPPALPDAPTFNESMEDFTERMRKRVWQLKFKESLDVPHRLIQRWMVLDQERAEEYKKWSWGRKPRFQHPEGKVVLEALNRLFFAWDSMGQA